MGTLPLLAQVSPQPADVHDDHSTAPFPPELASWTTSLGAEDALTNHVPLTKTAQSRTASEAASGPSTRLAWLCLSVSRVTGSRTVGYQHVLSSHVAGNHMNILTTGLPFPSGFFTQQALGIPEESPLHPEDRGLGIAGLRVALPSHPGLLRAQPLGRCMGLVLGPIGPRGHLGVAVSGLCQGRPIMWTEPAPSTPRAVRASAVLFTQPSHSPGLGCGFRVGAGMSTLRQQDTPCWTGPPRSPSDSPSLSASMQSSRLPAHSPVCGHQVCKLGCADAAVAAPGPATRESALQIALRCESPSSSPPSQRRREQEEFRRRGEKAACRAPRVMGNGRSRVGRPGDSQRGNGTGAPWGCCVGVGQSPLCGHG